MIRKIFFWLIVIAVGFVNPLLSGGLVILYYLPKIISGICNIEEPIQTSGMKSYSDDVVEEMR